MPAENGVRRHDRGHHRQRPPSEPVPQGCEASPFRITEPQASTAQLRPQEPVLFPQECDRVVLLSRCSHPQTATTNQWNGSTGEFYVSDA